MGNIPSGFWRVNGVAGPLRPRWFIPPGLGIMAIVGGLYVMNVGLDEVFNPRLRDS